MTSDRTSASSAKAGTPHAYFDEMYREPDPWDFESSWYERRKYAVTLASLPRERYRRAFEPGCSIGVLTEALAARCDDLVAAEFHPVPADRARHRLRGQDHVAVEQYAVPDEWPTGSFDLVVLSEIAYYFDDDRLTELEHRVERCLRPGGDLVLVHWTGPTDYPQSGDEVHRRWCRKPALDLILAHRETLFRLDVLRLHGGDRVS